jgi:hypothetical protein
MGINWNLIQDLNWNDWRFLREPILWAALVSTVALAVWEGVAGGWTWNVIGIGVVNAVLALFVRAQVTAPLPPKSGPDFLGREVPTFEEDE